MLPLNIHKFPSKKLLRPFSVLGLQFQRLFQRAKLIHIKRFTDFCDEWWAWSVAVNRTLRHATGGFGWVTVGLYFWKTVWRIFFMGYCLFVGWLSGDQLGGFAFSFFSCDLWFWFANFYFSFCLDGILWVVAIDFGRAFWGDLAGTGILPFSLQNSNIFFMFHLLLNVPHRPFHKPSTIDQNILLNILPIFLFSFHQFLKVLIDIRIKFWFVEPLIIRLIISLVMVLLRLLRVVFDYGDVCEFGRIGAGLEGGMVMDWMVVFGDL